MLGTVTGIINTFKLIMVFGSGDVKMLSGGISEALVTTETGLIIALPGLFFQYHLSRQLERCKIFLTHLETICTQMVYKPPQEQEVIMYEPPADDLLLAEVDLADIEPPPPSPPEQEPEPEPEFEEKPPELAEEAAPLDLSQLELALNPGFSEGWMGGGDFAVKLNPVVSRSKNEDESAVFSMADLDQKPRVIYQPSPSFSRELRRKAPGKVNVIFIVDENGRVREPRVKSSTDPVFEKLALNAVKRWKFEPGKRSGKAVRFRMLAPITFGKG